MPLEGVLILTEETNGMETYFSGNAPGKKCDNSLPTRVCKRSHIGVGLGGKSNGNMGRHLLVTGAESNRIPLLF